MPKALILVIMMLGDHDDDMSNESMMICHIEFMIRWGLTWQLGPCRAYEVELQPCKCGEPENRRTFPFPCNNIMVQWKNVVQMFLATLVAPHFTPVSDSVGLSVVVSI